MYYDLVTNDELLQHLKAYTPQMQETAIAPVKWHMQRCLDNPTLQKLAAAGKVEHYRATLIMLGLSYDKYLAERARAMFVHIAPLFKATPSLLASDIISAQSMTNPAGKIFKIKK